MLCKPAKYGIVKKETQKDVLIFEGSRTLKVGLIFYKDSFTSNRIK